MKGLSTVLLSTISSDIAAMTQSAMAAKVPVAYAAGRPQMEFATTRYAGRSHQASAVFNGLVASRLCRETGTPHVLLAVTDDG